MNIPNLMPAKREVEHIPPAVRYLFWLPVCRRNDFILLLLVYETLIHVWSAALLWNFQKCQMVQRKHGAASYGFALKISGTSPQEKVAKL